MRTSVWATWPVHERHRLIAQLKQLRSEMLLLAEAERQGSWTPSWQQLRSLPAAGSMR